MDKNTITAFALIALLLVGFSYVSRPSQEQLDAQKRYYDSIALVQQQEQEALEAKTKAALANEQEELTTDSTALFFNALKGNSATPSIKNDLLTVTFDTKGGRVLSAQLADYDDQQGQPVVLFDGDEASFNINFYSKKDGAIQTKDYYFNVVNRTDSSLTMRLEANADSYIDLKYSLKAGSYLMSFDIEAVNMGKKLASTKYIDIDWAQRTRQIEKGYTYEARLSELTYRSVEDGVESLSSTKNDTENPDGKVDWIAFKNQFFSSVFIANQDFDKVELKSEPEPKGSGFVKSYSAEMNTFFDPTGKEETSMYFYFGPNHFKTLSALDKGRDEKWHLDRLVYLGWPVVRQINKYIIINLFDWLTSWGLSMGIVLLLLTVIVKAAVYPTTWKTYMSSAKMRVLKPKIQEINNKYPKQEDAMKKQQETMALYNQYGVSPMGGCLPMLLQFPILMSLFMFLPSAIELRHQSFLWASDLSTYDAFVTFPFHIPLLGDHLSLFCLLMTVVNIVNTKYTMQQQDNGTQPEQMAMMKWMMYLMPLMFFFILNDYPSGLNYYYFLSTLISVATNIYMRKVTDDERLLRSLEANKKDVSQMKKSGFAARLEALQKQQEQMMKERQNNNKR